MWLPQLGHNGNSIDSTKAGFGFAWGPHPPGTYIQYLGMAVTPMVSGTSTSYVWISVQIVVNTTLPFTFAFLSTLSIKNCTSYQVGWTWPEIDGNASAIKLDYTAPSNISRSGVTLISAIGCYVTGLPIVYDHGKYTLIVPLGSGLPYSAETSLRKGNSYLETITDQRIDFMLYLPMADTISSTFPSFWAGAHGFNPNPNFRDQTIRYYLNESTDLTVTYENPE